MEGDTMRMREVDAIDLPAGREVRLEPGGLHLMLMGLKAPLKAGDKLSLTLRFERAGEVTLDVPISAKAP
jgi:copper(I)-binding protein